MNNCTAIKPSLSEPHELSVTLSIRLTLADFRMLEAIAAGNNRRNSVEARTMVLAAMNDLNDEKNLAN